MNDKPKCFVCGEGTERGAGIFSLPGINSTAAPGCVHAFCAVIELARIRTADFLAAQPE